jgi:serine/threonine protein kinase
MMTMLGKGSHGKVYGPLDADYVIKYVELWTRDREDEDPFLFSGVIMEPAALYRLKVCNVPYIVDIKTCAVNTVGDSIKMVLERLDPLPVYDAYSNETIRRHVAQLFTALAGMHSVDVYHGDIKRDNIMYNKNLNEIRLIDFSLAHVDKPSRMSKWEELFTLTHRAPELLLRSNYADRAKCDVWAAGVTACEMILGTKNIIGTARNWCDALEGVIEVFGSMPGCELYPMWEVYTDRAYKREGRQNDTVSYRINEAVGAAAAEFVRFACHPDPSKRWTALQLLNHPYISNLVDWKLGDIKQPATIIIHPSTLVSGTLYNEIDAIAYAMLKKLEITNSPRAVYEAARMLSTAYYKQASIYYPQSFDFRALAMILKGSTIAEFLAYHLFVNTQED